MEDTNTKKTKAKEKLWGKMYKGGTKECQRRNKDILSDHNMFTIFESD